MGASGAGGAGPRVSSRPATAPTRPRPCLVTLPAAASAVAAGAAHSCAIVADGTVWCWGANDDGQLGDGDTASTPTPTPVAGLTEARQLGAGAAHTCALRADGGVWCWGGDFAGQLGDGVDLRRLTPVLARLACH